MCDPTCSARAFRLRVLVVVVTVQTVMTANELETWVVVYTVLWVGLYEMDDVQLF
jgi:hypothetical protein